LYNQQLLEVLFCVLWNSVVMYVDPTAPILSVEVMRVGCCFVHVDGVKQCLWTATDNGPIVHPTRYYMSSESHGGMILTEEEPLEKHVPVALFPPHPARIDQGANSDLRCEMPVTNRLSHGTTMAGFV
jgi:hypothetical protein